ncbi:class I SAM-dependent methyltransferase [Euzebya tangerina]|uniref:class I SAM-dependent methyltransferase n=1 Tax=Euzebya tangerina TaxID=591198 RepID=UPI000E319089|nr:class I SAM-dependent methyltransferase [Euzebya tangerina]
MAATPDPDPFPAGFFARQDERPDSHFYAMTRMVQHIDDGAVEAVGELYEQLGADGRVLDLCSSWVSHLRQAPDHLTVLGMNDEELAANPMADEVVVHDLNADPVLPFDDHSFDAVVCTVSVDYLTRPVEVVRDVGRVLVPGGLWCCTFSNRLFPTKAIAGWLYAAESERPRIAAAYIQRAGGFGEITVSQRPTRGKDPVWGVWARTPGRPEASATDASGSVEDS